MTGGMMLAVAAIVAGNAQAAPDVAVPLAPLGKWTVGHEGGMCTLARDFGTPTADAVTFGVKPMSLWERVRVVLIVPKSRAGHPSQPGGAQLKTLPGAAAIPVADERSGRTRDGAIAISVTIARTDMPALMAAPAFSLATGTLSVAIAPTAGLQALAALTNCETALVAGWGIDPRAVAAVATPAVETSPDWRIDVHYPPAALAHGTGGRSIILWQIDLDGKVSGCRILQSAGDQALDNAACTAVTRYARYTPALDKNGRTVLSWSTQIVTWIRPD